MALLDARENHHWPLGGVGWCGADANRCSSQRICRGATACIRRPRSARGASR